ncbi:hypothetical protein [Sphingomonas bacterium]|uniref:hypothetical protein n=1 Tax=Sphingomonas bacterium TaxID=1895847 RepID=UPI001C2D1A00|nr:hypothetical protein [Sphingomonas bacterium]
MKPVFRMVAVAAVTVASLSSAYVSPVFRTLFVAAASTAAATPALAQTTSAMPKTVHFGTEIWTATDHGAGEAANYDYVIGNGSDVRLLGIYGNAALDNAKPDLNDREFLFSISSANNTGSGQLAGTAYEPSHHSVDSAIFAGILKQAGGSNATVPVNVTFPGGGIPLARGAVRIAAVTGVYDSGNAYKPIVFPNNNVVLSSELHVTFVYSN